MADGNNENPTNSLSNFCNTIGYEQDTLNQTIDQTSLGLANTAAGRVINNNYFGANQQLGNDLVKSGNFGAVKGPASQSAAKFGAATKGLGLLGGGLMGVDAACDLSQTAPENRPTRAVAITVDDGLGLGVGAAGSGAVVLGGVLLGATPPGWAVLAGGVVAGAAYGAASWYWGWRDDIQDAVKGSKNPHTEAVNKYLDDAAKQDTTNPGGNHLRDAAKKLRDAAESKVPGAVSFITSGRDPTDNPYGPMGPNPSYGTNKGNGYDGLGTKNRPPSHLTGNKADSGNGYDGPGSRGKPPSHLTGNKADSGNGYDGSGSRSKPPSHLTGNKADSGNGYDGAESRGKPPAHLTGNKADSGNGYDGAGSRGKPPSHLTGNKVDGSNKD